MWWLLVLQLWTTFGRIDPNVVLDGNWQSCRQDDGEYGERIYERIEHGEFVYEFHMGPYHDFGLYETRQPDEHQHDDPANLLAPSYRAQSLAGSSTNLGGSWTVTVHGQRLKIDVVLAGGSRDDCESFVVTIRRASHHHRRPQLGG